MTSFSDLVRKLLHHNPAKQVTARQALQHPLFTEKVAMPIPKLVRLNVAQALP